jgi:DNA-binding transcriptional regulator GbsR (MarR family)
LISEGFNYLLEKSFIELKKIKGIRKRFYIMASIGYSNYLKQINRFESIKKLKPITLEAYKKALSHFKT